jgi:hypothetical protein
VNSRSQKYSLLFKFERSLPFHFDPIYCFLLCKLNLITSTKCDHLHRSSFETSAEYFSMKIKVRIFFNFILNFLHLLNRFLIAEGVRESKVSCLSRSVVECMSEAYVKAIGTVIVVDIAPYTFPLLLGLRKDPIDRP